MLQQEVVGSVHVNPAEIEHWLSRATFCYPRNHEADFNRGWSQFAAIPNLHRLQSELRRFPRPDEGVAFLMKHCEPAYAGLPEVRRRGEKLYLDYARDMHAKGLLDNCELFGYVAYQKALDLSYNVDFFGVVAVLTGE